MKKIASFLLALVLCFGLAGCGEKGDDGLTASYIAENLKEAMDSPDIPFNLSYLGDFQVDVNDEDSTTLYSADFYDREQKDYDNSALAKKNGKVYIVADTETDEIVSITIKGNVPPYDCFDATLSLLGITGDDRSKFTSELLGLGEFKELEKNGYKFMHGTANENGIIKSLYWINNPEYS